ncbi:MAG: hypothetical protein ABEK50_02990 [bacterium]
MAESNLDSTVRGKRVKSAVRFFSVGRMAIGTTFLLAPKFSSRRLLAGYRSSAETLTFGRMAAGRDLALGIGTLLASWSETNSEFEWLVAGLIADSVDVYAFWRDESCRLMPRLLSGLVAAGAVGLGLWTTLNLNALENSSSADGTQLDD